MRHKYVRFKDYGFVLWPYSDTTTHLDVAREIGYRVESAGFVTFDHGIPHCYGESISIGIGHLPDDDDALKAQLGF